MKILVANLGSTSFKYRLFNMTDEDWDTVGGLVLGLAGRVPREGESFEFDQVVLTADRVQGRRVARVRISRR